MRVLQLISSSGFYGADNVLIELVKELLYTDFVPIIGVFKNVHNPHLEVAEVADRHGLSVVIFPCNGKLDPKTILLIRKYFQKQRIDIIHTHGYKSNLYALASSAGKSIPKICTCHNWLGDDPKMRFYAWLDKLMLKRFDAVVAVSGSVRREILNQCPMSEKVATIFNGINIQEFNRQKKLHDIRKELRIDKHCKIIGTVGRLSEEKGHSHLLHAAQDVFKEHPDVVFLFVGDGPLRQKLEEKAFQLASTALPKGQNGQGPFVFTGVRSDLPAIYSIMDIFVLPSLTEGLPMVLLEAMASHKPVVATKVGAIPSVIEHGLSGLLVQPGDVGALAHAINDFLSDASKAKRLANSAFETVKKRFSSKIMAEKYVELYQDVLGIRGTAN